MKVIPTTLTAINWIINKCYNNENMWEVTLDVGNMFINLPFYFESREEISRYINNATFEVLEYKNEEDINDN